MDTPYKMIDHTGDAGAVIYGATKEELFVNAAFAMIDLMIDRSTVAPRVTREISVNGEDQEDLLVRWLSELNYLVETEHEIFSEFEIEHISDTRLCANARGEALDPLRHQLHTAIKAVTYHQLYIRETGDGYEAQVIFDL